MSPFLAFARNITCAYHSFLKFLLTYLTHFYCVLFLLKSCTRLKVLPLVPEHVFIIFLSLKLPSVILITDPRGARKLVHSAPAIYLFIPQFMNLVNNPWLYFFALQVNHEDAYCMERLRFLRCVLAPILETYYVAACSLTALLEEDMTGQWQ